MQMSEYIAELYKEKASVKILHYNAKDLRLKNELGAHGYHNYLGLSLKKPHPGLYPVDSKTILKKNNADIIILHNAGFQELANAFRSSAEVLIYKPNRALSKYAFLPALALLLAKGKPWTVRFNVFIDADGKVSRGIVFKRKYNKKKTARHYLSPDANIADFFGLLNSEKLKYTVLRWYDEPFFSDIDEDIDLLVADDDVGRIQEMLDEKIGILPFDVYSVSGLPGSAYKDMSYYRPQLAQQIIEHRELWNEKYFVPDKWHYFLSLMYHAVYHKGEKSGVPAENGEAPKGNGDHDYLAVLQQLAIENNVKLEHLNLSYFHEFLERQGWAPATDTIRKLSLETDGWLHSVIKANESNFEKNGELMVFVIREWAAVRGLENHIANWFEENGLNVVKMVHLTAEQKKKAAQNLRGGNWGQGPWPVSGGDPAALMIVYDHHPKALTPRVQKKYPHVSNEHYLLKDKLRREINGKLPLAEKTNVIHSADDEIEALEYIQATVPEVLAEVKATIKKWDQEYATLEHVIEDISENKRRAKVELIEFDGKKAVKKTFKAGKERFLNREKYVYGELSKECEFIPKLIASGENYIIVPYMETLKLSQNEFIKKKMLKKYKNEIFRISEFFYEKGYALIDFHPGNLLITKDGLKVIDFEFLYRYERLPENSHKSFDLMGFPDDFTGDKPYGIKGRHRRKVWKKILN